MGFLMRGVCAYVLFRTPTHSHAREEQRRLCMARLTSPTNRIRRRPYNPNADGNPNGDGTFQSISLNWETLERRCRFQWSTVSMMIPSWPLRQLGHSRSVCETWMLGWLTITKPCAVFENYLEIFLLHRLPVHEGVQGAAVVL